MDDSEESTELWSLWMLQVAQACNGMHESKQLEEEVIQPLKIRLSGEPHKTKEMDVILSFFQRIVVEYVEKWLKARVPHDPDVPRGLIRFFVKPIPDRTAEVWVKTHVEQGIRTASQSNSIPQADITKALFSAWHWYGRWVLRQRLQYVLAVFKALDEHCPPLSAVPGLLFIIRQTTEVRNKHGWSSEEMFDVIWSACTSKLPEAEHGDHEQSLETVRKEWQHWINCPEDKSWDQNSKAETLSWLFVESAGNPDKKEPWLGRPFSSILKRVTPASYLGA
ncbi:hypothetical protein OIV83_006147 [Microbotryomycetes sp. JL201]|nr:hypothetical protein OIV83_006147 [Microbotryomycetes sp. JL201]